MIGRILIISPKYFDEMEWNSTLTMANNSCANDIHSEFDESTDGIRHVAYRIVAPIILIGGILGNILNLIVLRKPFLKACTRLFLTALAISDLSVMITVIPMVFRLNKYHGNSFETAFFYAHIELFLTNIFITASVLIVVCLTIERYFSVCHPTTFKNLHTRKNARNGIIWCYVFGLLISFPLTVLKRVCIIKEYNNSCLMWEFEENTFITHSMYWTLYLWLSEFLIRLGPCVVLGVLNILIIKKFRKVTARRKLLLATLTQSNNDTVNVRNTKKSL